MRLVSWNVNGIRAAVKKDFVASLTSMNPDVLCLQETKAQDDQVIEALAELSGYSIFPNSAEKKGYSGTAILTRVEPVAVHCDMGIEQHDLEGRITTAEFERFFLVTVYTPNSGNGLKRLDYRQQWDSDFVDYLKNLEKRKPVIVCGDLNVAHNEIDLARPKSNYNKTAGYTQKEIDGMDTLLNSGFVDSFRLLHEDTIKYSWWSYRMSARERNVGWRLDYFLVSQMIAGDIQAAEILNDIHGSDHCPVLIDLNL